MQKKTSRKDATHDRIVQVAARTLRKGGYAALGVADVMMQAGLTHGGFYAHFPSRDALLAEAIAHAGQDGAALMGRRIRQRRSRGHSALHALIDAYLSDAHLRDAEGGCVVAALASEMHRQEPALRELSAARVKGLIALVQQALPQPNTADQATAIASALVGAMQLARALGPNAQGKAVLAATRCALLAQYDKA